MTAELILVKLEGVQGKGPHWRAICPAHVSRHKSRTLSIMETQDGRVLLHCHAGCSVEQIVNTVGLDLSDLFPPKGSDDERGPRVRKPWSNREVAKALEIDLTFAFMILRKVGTGARISQEERNHALHVSDACSAMLMEMTR